MEKNKKKIVVVLIVLFDFHWLIVFPVHSTF